MGITKGKVWLGHTLYWELGTDRHWTTWVVARIYLERRDQVYRLWEAFYPHPPGLSHEEADKEIWLSHQVSRTEIADFHIKLDDVLCRWIELWKRVGGLKVFATDSST
jgi:hypothetical protein